MNQSNINLQCSEWLVNAVKKAEGLRLTSYICPAGKPTIGWGSTLGVKMGTTITLDQAEALLASDITRATNIVLKWVTVPIKVPQLDALVSFVFNLGGGALQTSTLLAKLNAGDILGAANQFQFWDKDHDPKTGLVKTLPGLTIRRLNEYKRFTAGVIPCMTKNNIPQPPLNPKKKI